MIYLPISNVHIISIIKHSVTHSRNCEEEVNDFRYHSYEWRKEKYVNEKNVFFFITVADHVKSKLHGVKTLCFRQIELEMKHGQQVWSACKVLRQSSAKYLGGTNCVPPQ